MNARFPDADAIADGQHNTDANEFDIVSTARDSSLS